VDNLNAALLSGQKPIAHGTVVAGLRGETYASDYFCCRECRRPSQRNGCENDDESWDQTRGGVQFAVVDPAVPLPTPTPTPSPTPTATATATPTATPPPTVQFTSSIYGVDEEVEKNVILTVIRMGDLSHSSTVHYSTHDGTAIAGTDYTSTSGTLTFPVGESVETISVPILDDGNINEPTSATFDVLLDMPAGATLGNPSEAVVTILDREPAPTPTPTPTPPMPTPTPSPGFGGQGNAATAQAVNLSTRLFVQPGDNVAIAGFIVQGNVPKKVIVRGIGPSLVKFGITGFLADPVLELHGASGILLARNDNWKDSQPGEIRNSGIEPLDDLESAIVATLTPGNYTAILSGKNGTSGVGLVEVYDLDQAATSYLANVSTRGFVQTGGNVMIAGVILGNSSAAGNIVVRGIGPSLSSFGITNVLADPTLELRNGDGFLVMSDDNWKDNASQSAAITASGLAPTNDLEAAIAISLSPGVYTAILAGHQNSTGVGLVEIYNR
jgi:hypothetical protein